MAVEKVGVYRKWLEPVPQKDGKPIPRSQWPKRRRHHWIARWYGSNGKRYGKVFETRKEAERHASRLQSRVFLGKADKPPQIALKEFRLEHERVMKGRVAFATLDDQIRALKFFEKFIGESILLSKIKPRHAEAFIAHRLSTVRSVDTVNKDIRTLRHIFNLAIEPRGYLAEGQNPFIKLKQRKTTKKPIRYVTTKEYRELMDETGRLWWQALMSVAFCSGLRRNEILSLMWADIDFENHYIYVRAKKGTEELLVWEPKDHENRVVPMSEETGLLLARMQAEAEESHPYIFISPKCMERINQRRKEGKWNSRSAIINNLRTNFHRIRCRAGVAMCTLHDLRRSAITNWAKKLPIQVVQQLAGHSDIKTTRQYYLSVRPEDLLSARHLLNSILAEVQEH